MAEETVFKMVVEGSLSVTQEDQDYFVGILSLNGVEVNKWGCFALSVDSAIEEIKRYFGL